MKSIILAVGIVLATAASAEDGWQSVKTRAESSGPGRAASVSSPEGGTLQVFADQGLFEAAVGGTGVLAVESFDGGATEPGTARLCDEPVSSLSNDTCFSPGDLEGGFEITSSSGTGIDAFGSGFFGAGQPSPVLGAIVFADLTIVTFTSPVHAFSMDVYDVVAGNDVVIEVFDSLGASLGTATATPASNETPVFIGIVSDQPIARITLNAAGNGGELLDNLRFAGGDLIFRDGFGGVAAVPPSVAKAFAPTGIEVGANSVLSITLENPNGMPATLSSDLVDAFPQGMVVADPSDAATTCLSAIVSADAGDGTVTLGAGAEIPANGSCAVTVSVTSAMAGFYPNVIPAGALQTDLGANQSEAEAELAVSDPATCTPLQLLQDPGFEATDGSGIPFTNPYWESTSTVFGTAYCDNGCGLDAYDGTFYAWLGGAAWVPETATVSQAVTIPAGQTRFLNFWLWIAGVDDGSTYMDVSVDQTIVTTFLEPVAPDAGYEHRGVDVSSYADGASHTIAFIYTSPGSGVSSFLLDDITIDCTPASNAHALPASAGVAEVILRATP